MWSGLDGKAHIGCNITGTAGTTGQLSWEFTHSGGALTCFLTPHMRHHSDTSPGDVMGIKCYFPSLISPSGDQMTINAYFHL